MIKFIVSDMDGTLFDGHGETVFDLTKRNEEALKKCKDANIEFCVASGRMIGFGIRLMEKYQFSKVRAAGFNGAVCYDQGNFVSVYQLDMNLIRQIVDMLNREYPDCEVIQVQGLNSERIFTDLNHPIIDYYKESIEKIGIGKVMDFTVEDFLAGKTDTLAGKLSVTMPTKERTLEVKDKIKAIVQDACFVTMSNDTLIEIGNASANKGVFVKYLKEAYHLDRDEIAVIGDAMNDTEMFPESAYTFAMRSGNDQVKKMADYVVDDVAECIDICLKLNEKMK